MKKNGYLKFFLIVLGIFLIWLIIKRREVKKHNEEVDRINAQDISKSDSSQQKMKTEDFEVIEMETKYQPQLLKNIDVLVKHNVGKNEAQEICKKIREFYYPYPCNIDLYDNVDALYKGLEYPLEGSDRKFVSKHYIAMSTFDAPEAIMMYPVK